MSEWESRIRDHRVWALLETLGPAIDKASAIKEIDQPSLEALLRLRITLALCGKRIGAADPLTIPPASLEGVANALGNQQAQVEAFTSDRNIAHLNDANANADAALVHLSQIPGIQTREELIKLMDVTSSYRSELDGSAREWRKDTREGQVAIKELRQTYEEFKSQSLATIAELKGQLEGERQKIANQATEQQKAFADAQEARSNTYTETLRKTQETLNKTLSEQQGQFSTAQENRGAQFTTVQTEMQKRFGDLVGDYTKRLADQDAEFTKQRDTMAAEAGENLSNLGVKYDGEALLILKDVKKRREEVEKLVGIIGNLGVTSGYQKAANNAQKTMWFWQGVAVVAMVAVILFAYFAFIPALKGEFHWSGFATRVFLTVTVGVLAAYAVKQADRFFHEEKQNRRLALELTAIDPFIALLPIEEQQKFKLDIGRRTFAREDNTGIVTPDKSPATALDVLLGSKEGQQTFQTLVQAAVELSSKLPKMAK